MLIVYDILVRLSNIFLMMGALFVPKWKTMLAGRRETLAKVKDFKEKNTSSPIWFHCASLGEFEQGRTLIEAIKERDSNQRIVLSFFSPSGYEIQKNYKHADLIFYLPSDTVVNQRDLVNILQPKAFYLIKYEFWWNALRVLQDRKIPIYVVSAVFRGSDYFFKPWLAAFKQILSRCTHFFVQDSLSANVLANQQIQNVTIAGDTRIDRVINRSQNVNTPDNLVNFLTGKKVIVYGSIWHEDMKIVNPCIDKLEDYVHVIAPHDVSKQNVSALRNMISKPSIFYSQSLENSPDVILIDSIGLLSGLYRYATIAYIGGGFGSGIHNTLEPAAYKIPVFFGPKHIKFNEAVEMVKREVAFTIEREEDITSQIEIFQKNPSVYSDIQKKLDIYLSECKGATNTILTTINSLDQKL